MSKFHWLGNCCNSKKGIKILFFFANISKTVWNFSFSLRSFTDIEGLYGMAEKRLGISLKLRQRVPNFYIYIGVSLKVHWRFSVDHMGRHLCRSVEGRWPHSCITFKKSLLIPNRRSGPKFSTVFWNISKMVWNYGIMSLKFYRGLGAIQNGCKKFGISLKRFCQNSEFFHRGLCKGLHNLYY